jgi:hypothetical protein
MMPTMWKQYQKTVIPIQLTIFIVCGGAYFIGKLPLLAVILIFLTMQIGAIGGAWWGTKIRKRIMDQDDSLPLNRQ